MPEQYRIDVTIRQKFEQVGLGEIASAARREIAKIADNSSLQPQERQAAIQGVNLAARERIENIRSGGPDAAGFDSTREFRKQLGLAERDLTNFGKALNNLATKTNTTAGLNAQQAAAVQTALKSGGQLLTGEAERAAVAAARQRETRASELGVSPEAVGAAAERVGSLQGEAEVQRVLAADKNYAEVMAQLATLRQVTQAQVNEVLAADNTYAEATARASRARNIVAAQVARAESAPENIAAAANRRLEEQRLRRRQDFATESGTTQGDIEDQALTNQLVAANRRKLAIAEEELRIDRQVVQETAQLAALKARRAREERRALLAATAGDVPAQADLAARERSRDVDLREARLRREATPAGQRDVARGAQVTAAEQARTAAIDRIIQEELSANRKYIENKAASTVAEQRRTAATRESVAKLRAADPGLIASEGRAAARERANADRLAAQAARQTTKSDISAAVERRIAERELSQAIRAREQVEVRNAVAAGRLGGQGTFFQRLQSQVASRREGAGGVRAPAEFATLGQFATSKALTTAGFALSGAVLFGAIAGFKQLITEAENLERVLNQVEAQFNSIGQGDQFEGFRESILSISRETGASADEVATVAFQFKGAFGDTTQAVEQTAAAFQIVKVTGLELSEVVDQLTASSLTFGVGIDEIGDKALGLQERFGVLAKETINFVSELAPVAEEVGLTFDELAALGATAQQVSGKSGTALAEGFNRILPAIQGSKTEILDLYRTIPQLQPNFDAVLGNFAAGQTGPVLIQLIRDYESLSQAQKNYVIELLGGRREAQALIPVLNNSSKFLAELDNSYDDAGKTQAYFADLQETLSQRLAVLREAFTQLGEALFRAGLADILTGAAFAGTAFASVLGVVIRALAAVNEASGGFVGRFVAVLALVKGAQLAFVGLSAAKNLAAAASARVAVAAAGEAVATEASAVASEHEAVASTAAAVADTAEAGASGTAAAANAAEAATGGAAGAGGLVGRARAGLSALGARALAPVGAVGLGAVATAGLVGVKVVNDRAQANIRVAREEAALRLRESDAEYINELASSSDSMWEVWNRGLGRLTLGVLGDRDGPDVQELAAAEANRRNAQAAGAEELLEVLNQSDVLTEFLAGQTFTNPQTGGSGLLGIGDPDSLEQQLNPEVFRDIVEKALGGDADAVALLNDIKGRMGPELVSEIDQFLADVEAGVDPNQSDTQRTLDRFETVKAKFESGAISEVAYLRRLRGQIATHQAEVDAGGEIAEAQQALAQEEAEAAKIVSDRIQRAFERREAILEATGQTTPGQTAQRQLALLRSGNLTVEAEAELLPNIFANLRSQFEADLDEVERLFGIQARIAAERQGFAIPAELQAAAVQGQLLDDPGFQRFTDGAQYLGTADKEGFADELAERVARTDETIREAARAILVAKRDELLRILEVAGGAFGAGGAAIADSIADLNADIANLDRLGAVEVQETGARGHVDAETERAAAEEAAQAALAERTAYFNLLKSRTQDPVAIARLDLQIANEELAYANAHGNVADRRNAEAARNDAIRALQDSQNDIVDARLELAAAQASRDPIRAAEIAIAQADAAAARAQGEAARIRALAQRVAADQQHRAAILDYYNSLSRLQQAIFEAAGNVVGAAREGLRQALNNLRDLLSDPSSGAAARNDARAAVVQARAVVRDARFNDRLGDIDFLLEMERVTTGQAIQMLQNLAQIPKLTQDQLRTIQRRIKQLQDELGQDYQFNLPTELGLPTLYQVQRADQTGSRAFTDQRQIEMNIYISENVDLASLERVLSNGVGTNVNGSIPRRY